MKIDIPMTLAFDCDRIDGFNRPKHTVTFTWRLDKDDTNDTGTFSMGYPPNEKSQWHRCGDSGPGEVMTGRIWDAIKAAAERSPIDYASDLEEGERLQVIANANREPL